MSRFTRPLVALVGSALTAGLLGTAGLAVATASATAAAPSQTDAPSVQANDRLKVRAGLVGRIVVSADHR